MKPLYLTFVLALSLNLIACATNTKRNENKSSPAVEEDETPSITKAKIKSIVVPDTIEGNRYIKSHRVYILEDAGSWSKD